MGREEQNLVAPATLVPGLIKCLLGVELWKFKPFSSLQVFQQRQSRAAEADRLLRPSDPAGSAQHIVKPRVHDHDDHVTSQNQQIESEICGTEPPSSRGDTSFDEDTPPIRICIIGAGIAGLYLAMMLDDLGLSTLSYDILESRDRIGGRVYTHKFEDGKDNYYDVGAMRFPKVRRAKQIIIDSILNDLDSPVSSDI